MSSSNLTMRTVTPGQTVAITTNINITYRADNADFQQDIVAKASAWFDVVVP